jgi:hypothetical protein
MENMSFWVFQLITQTSPFKRVVFGTWKETFTTTELERVWLLKSYRVFDTLNCSAALLVSGWILEPIPGLYQHNSLSMKVWNIYSFNWLVVWYFVLFCFVLFCFVLFCLFDVTEDPNKCVCTRIVYLDPKGSIPIFVVNLFVVSHSLLSLSHSYFTTFYLIGPILILGVCVFE